MYLYHLTDDQGWKSSIVRRTLREAREAALDLMDKAAWVHVNVLTIYRIDTAKEKYEMVEYVIHGEHRAEARKVEDK